MTSNLQPVRDADAELERGCANMNAIERGAVAILHEAAERVAIGISTGGCNALWCAAAGPCATLSYRLAKFAYMQFEPPKPHVGYWFGFDKKGRQERVLALVWAAELIRSESVKACVIKGADYEYGRWAT